jgi:hypothetical protein
LKRKAMVDHYHRSALKYSVNRGVSLRITINLKDLFYFDF